MECHLFKTHVRAYEVYKFIGTDFSQPLKSCDFRLRSEVFYGVDTFFFSVTITRDEVTFLLFPVQSGVCFSNHLLVLNLRALVSDAEKWGLKHVNMPFLDEFRKELKEEGYYQQADMHAVNIGISSHYHLIISQCIKSFFNIKCSLKQVEFFILIHHFLRQSE